MLISDIEHLYYRLTVSFIKKIQSKLHNHFVYEFINISSEILPE